MTPRPTTAAEALKQSKTGKIKQSYETLNFVTFDKERLIFLETLIEEEGDEGKEIIFHHTHLLVESIWLPYDPEPVDAELEQAQKLVGQWVKQKKLYHAKQVFSVYTRADNQIYFTDEDGYSHLLKNCSPVWVSEPRCCRTQKPKESGHYLTCLGGVRKLASFSQSNQQWYTIDDCLNITENLFAWHWYDIPDGYLPTPQGGK